MLPAQARLAFTRSPDGVTFLARQQVSYPYHVGRVLRLPTDPEPMATVLLQSCSGGIFEGEELGLSVSVGPGAMAHLSTGASTIVHGMREGEARQRTCLEVGANALLEYLPKPTVLFSRAQLLNEVDVSLSPQASLLLWDVCMAHGPGGDLERFGHYHSVTRVRDSEGRLQVLDRMRIQGADLGEPRTGINGGFGTLGTFFILTRKVNASLLVEYIRNVSFADEEVYVGTSELPGNNGVWVRVLAKSAVVMAKQLKCIRGSIRPLLMDALEAKPARSGLAGVR
ncbi:urease accessory protein UreD [Stutzerimonas tarimensis]|uniref:Urease accessory protein UreD n=1 Tax=Stutzerimonas tarimensis TaxID=1507735 RepID=A0ABV7T9I1_9GAMM